MNLKIELPSKLCFDFTNMFGDKRLQEQEVVDFLASEGNMAVKALQNIAATGYSKKHLSKDGTPEPILFQSMPYIGEGKPNTEASIAKLREYGAYLKNNVDAIIFLGVGGSYLGNKVLFDIFGGPYWNTDAEKRQGMPRIYFSGNNLDAVDCDATVHELARLAKEQPGLKVMLVPISKSGTTLETVAGYLYFYTALSKNTDINLECTVVTDLLADEKDAPLLALAKRHNWWMFDIKEGIGGRFCVMTDPGLITLAALGGDIEAFLAGARDLAEYVKTAPAEANPALVNATLKYLAYQNNRDIEVFMPYTMNLKSLGEWYVQLLAESLGKRHNREGEIVYYGRTPVAAVGTTDMHAQTQQHQDGRLNKVVQFLKVTECKVHSQLSNAFENMPFFDRYDGMCLCKALHIALESNKNALTSDNRYNACFVLPELNEYYLGQIMYFLMLSVAYEGELADVDAFDQPGVEVYKKFIKEHLYK